MYIVCARLHGCRSDNYLESSRYASKEGGGRAASGTKTESRVWRRPRATQVAKAEDAYTDVGSRVMQEQLPSSHAIFSSTVFSAIIIYFH